MVDVGDAAEAARAGAGGGGGEQQAEPPKSIILFSDGTGNSSAKLFKTNVWRMYEAVDLGPPQEGEHKQIAFYDNGVGTSALKPIAAIGSVFGIGLRRNVLDIYRYACRNYAEGDRIYGFGFSRGAFTMRIAIALIASEGLVPSKNEAELEWKSQQAWRAYRTRFVPRRWSGLTRLGRAIGAGWRAVTRASPEPYKPSDNRHPVIEFVGVWDTVAAYGGPITEITRAIDNWIVRLTMFDHKLNRKVRCARQALSIDDERDAFRPIPWDEIAEKDLIAKADRKKEPWLNENRLEQVWFTGMHADVGGGYPDESLSFVSFLWMMEEAKKAGLRPVARMVKHFRALASSDGPIHDSRSGVGSYYRYQPRKIGAWLEPIDMSTFPQRDPDLERGLIEIVKVHESVAARIANGTDRYAPITLPAALRIVPPQAEGETKSESAEELPPAELPTEGAAPAVSNRATADAEEDEKAAELISTELRDRLQHRGLGAARVAKMEAVWRRVAWRRFLYFLTLALTLLLFTMPMWIDNASERAPVAPVFTSGHGLLATVIGLLAGILPAFLSGLIETWSENPFYFLVLLIGILGARAAGSALERSLRDRTREIWDAACDTTQPLPPVPDEEEPPPPPKPSAMQRFRRWMRWSFLPSVIGILFLLIALWLIVVTATRVSLALRERSDTFCAGATGTAPELTRVTAAFETGVPCHAVRASVTKGRTYIVDVDIDARWADGSHEATPAGLRARDIGFIGYLGAPLRRAVGANYLQPMAHIRAKGEWWAGPSIVPLRVIQQGSPRTRWRGSFVAPRSGELSLFANDATLPYPFRATLFYDHPSYGNQGSAKVTIVRADHVVERTAATP